jgi:serine/threonine-protein kinase
VSWICARCRTRFEQKALRCPHDGKRVVEDHTGAVLADRYELRELIGVGGMDGTVWMAWQSSTHRQVAVKLLPAADDAAAERFARGARIASNLNHPHITIVHDYGRAADGKLFLVMELLEGRTLHRLLKDDGALPLDRALHVADQTLRALEHAHARRVVHRDLKPGNLFLVQKNDDPSFVKVLDFGIAKYVAEDPEADQKPELKHEVTEERQICGTPHYMAPEQVMMGRVDGRTDLYALGVVLYRMLLGRLPFDHKEHHELFRAHLHDDPPRFSAVRPDLALPAPVEDLVRRALAKAPEQRFAEAAEMRRALRQVRHNLGIFSGDDDSLAPGLASWPSAASVTVDVPAPAPRRRLWPWGVGAVAVAGAVAGVLLARSPEPAPVAQKAAAPASDAAVPRMVGVRVTTRPPGAEVAVDGEAKGQAPVSLALDPGTHALAVKLEGYRTESLELVVPRVAPPEGVTRDVELTALPPPPSAPPSVAKEPERPRPVAAARPVAPPPDKPAARASKPADEHAVKMNLLDEDGARAFPVAGPASAAAPAPRPAHAIQLLDDPDGATPAPPPPRPSAPPSNAKIQLLNE